MAVRTPRQIALIFASSVTLIISVALTIILFVIPERFSTWGVILFVILAFCLCYFLVHSVLEKFIYQQVKNIYKTIHSLQGQRPPDPDIKMQSDVLGKVRSEVTVWAEEKIREVSQLKASENFRKEFIGNLAHELKTPIFNIQGYIETLLDSELIDADLNRKFLEKASKSTDRIAELIKDLDDISNIDNGLIPLELTEFDIVDLCKNTIESLDKKAREKNISLVLKNPNEKPIPVFADQRKIEQVISNLLLNSINYGNEGGETRIRFYDMADNVLIEIADNGLGIAAEHLPRIFERFYRVTKSRARHEGGSGLGLAICKHIIEAHKQTINVRSTPEVGTTFGFTLAKA